MKEDDGEEGFVNFSMHANCGPDEDDDFFNHGQRLRVAVWEEGQKLGNHDDILRLGEAMRQQDGFALCIATWEDDKQKDIQDIGYGISYIVHKPEDFNLAGETSISQDRLAEFGQILERDYHLDWDKGITYMNGLGVVKGMRDEGFGTAIAHERLLGLLQQAKERQIKHLLFYTWGDVEKTLPLSLYKQFGFKKMAFTDEDRVYWICELVD